MSLICNLPNPPLHPPLLSPGFAVGACTLFTFTYVASLYLSPSGRLANKPDPDGRIVDRDHPVVIRARIKTASFATACTLLATGIGLWIKGVIPRSGWLLDTLNVARLLGLPLPVPTVLSSSTLPFDPPISQYLGIVGKHIFAPLLLTLSLFLGPLYVSYLDRTLPFQSRFSFQHDVVSKFTSLTGLRNYTVGPLTEELVFRSSILTPLFFAGIPTSSLIFLTPLFFGIAHIHHAYNNYLSGYSLSRSLLVATLQFSYTGVFGWYANFLFLRSGSVVPGIVAHVVCNVMGLPDPVAAGERHPKRRGWIWFAHAVGVVAFAKALMPLTSETVFGGSLYWP